MGTRRHQLLRLCSYLAELDAARGSKPEDHAAAVDAEPSASMDEEDDIDRMLNEELVVGSRRLVGPNGYCRK